MALDAVRWRATHMAPWLEVLGGLCILVSYLISCRTLAENSFAEPVVRIQKERGHKLITTGPYSIVRHPMYGGALLFLFGMPLLLGSSYGIAISLVLTVILAIRARLEERTLAAHFPEYKAYEETVRYRFVPFLW